MASPSTNPEQAARGRNAFRSITCSHSKIPPPIEPFDPQGDMMLVIGRQACADTSCNNERYEGEPDAICLLVNSAVVAGASSNFGMALYSPTGQSRSETIDRVKWTVELPDDPHAMRIIVQLIYGHGGILPPGGHMKIELLLPLTAIAHKYDLVHLFSDWAGRWTRDMEPYWVNEMFVERSLENLEALLWIFWVLGHEPLYTYMVLQIAFHCELDATGRFMDPLSYYCFSNEIPNIPVPPLAPIEVGFTRLEVLKLIRKEIKDALEEHLHGYRKSDGRPCVRMDGADDAGWRRNVFCSFVRVLDKEGLWPVPSSYEVTASPRSLIEVFHNNANLPSFVHHGGDDGGRFCDVDGTFWRRVENVLRGVYFTLPSVSVQYMGLQAEKSGLAAYFRARGLRLRAADATWNLRGIMDFQRAVVQSDGANYKG